MADEDTRLQVVRAMRASLRVKVTTTVRFAGASDCLQHYLADVEVCWSPDEGPEVDRAVLSVMSHIDVESYLPEVDGLSPVQLSIPVGRGDALIVDLARPECLAELASHSQDVGLVGAALMGERDDLSALRGAFGGRHQRALILNYIEIAPPWRGGDYGLVVADLLIGELGRCCDVVALYPMGRDLTDLDDRAQAARDLSHHWAKLGFEEFNGIMARTPSRADTRPW